MPARQPLGMVSPAMGGLGWGLPASVGLRMGLPDRPVVAVLGDGSTVFGIQGFWSAARYGIGPLVVVLKNGGYRIMDQLAARQGGPPAWPSFGAVDIAAIAEAFGCEARRIGDGEALTRGARRGRSGPARPHVAAAARGDGRARLTSVAPAAVADARGDLGGGVLQLRAEVRDQRVE